MNYWLMKSEPDTFGIDTLAQRKNQTEHWDGVRNYQARNFMKEMKKNDQAFFYHSSCEVPGIAGVVTITREAYPDFTAFDSKSKYYDASSSEENPRWFMVDVTLKTRFKEVLPLSELKELAALANNRLLARGNRLSIVPFSSLEWEAVMKLAESRSSS